VQLGAPIDTGALISPERIPALALLKTTDPVPLAVIAEVEPKVKRSPLIVRTELATSTNGVPSNSRRSPEIAVAVESTGCRAVHPGTNTESADVGTDPFIQFVATFQALLVEPVQVLMLVAGATTTERTVANEPVFAVIRHEPSLVRGIVIVVALNAATPFASVVTVDGASDGV